jgi:hypothetical protein
MAPVTVARACTSCYRRTCRPPCGDRRTRRTWLPPGSRNGCRCAYAQKQPDQPCGCPAYPYHVRVLVPGRSCAGVCVPCKGHCVPVRDGRRSQPHIQRLVQALELHSGAYSSALAVLLPFRKGRTDNGSSVFRKSPSEVRGPAEPKGSEEGFFCRRCPAGPGLPLATAGERITYDRNLRPA